MADPGIESKHDDDEVTAARSLRAIQTALRNVSDGQDVVADWEQQINELLSEDPE